MWDAICIIMISIGSLFSSSFAQSCDDVYAIIPLYKFKFRGGKGRPIEELAALFKAQVTPHSKYQSNTSMITVQTALLLHKSTGEVAEFFFGLKGTGYEPNEVGHSIIAQTILLTGRPSQEVIDFFHSNKDITALKVTSPGHSVILQTIFLTGRNPQEVVDYFKNFPRTGGGGTRQLTHSIVAQTAFLLDLPPQDVIRYYRKFPYIPGVTASSGLALIKQGFIGKDTFEFAD